MDCWLAAPEIEWLVRWAAGSIPLLFPRTYVTDTAMMCVSQARTVDPVA